MLCSQYRIMENINNTASLASFVSPNMAAPFEVTSRVLMSKAAGDAPLFNLMEKEVFVDIKNFEGLYQISTHGRIISMDPRKRSWIILTPTIRKDKKRNNEGYCSVGLWKGNIYKRKSIHRLVGEAFIPNPEKKPTINHIDGCKLNNYYLNLEWATYSENNQHAIDNGLATRRSGVRVHCAKLTDDNVRAIRKLLADGFSWRKIAKQFGVTKGSIQRIANRKGWNHVK